MPIFMNYSGIGGETKTGGDGKILAVKLGTTDLSPKNIEIRVKALGSATGGAGAGKVKFNEFTITKVTDSASPIFFRHSMVKGKVIPKITLNFLKTNAQGKKAPTLGIELTDATLASYMRRRNPSGNPTHTTTNEFEIEEIRFTFLKITVTWTDGGISATDDWLSG